MSTSTRRRFGDSNIGLHDLGIIADRGLLILSVVLFGLLVGDFVFEIDLWMATEILYLVLWLTFIVEFSVKLIISKDKLNYIKREFFVIFIILFPFLRPLRIFPASRMGLVVLAQQIGERFPLLKRLRVLEIVLISSILVILSADLFLLFEPGPESKFTNFSDALWFSVVTLATVGYGEIYPQTVFGRILATILIIFGFSVFGFVTATISSYFVEQNMQSGRRREAREHSELAVEEGTVEYKVDRLLEKIESLENEVRELRKEKLV